MTKDNAVNMNLIKILLIDSDQDYAKLLYHLLSLTEDKDCPWQIKHVLNLDEASFYLDEEAFDVLLLGLSFPEQDGMESVTKLNVRYPMIPIVVLTRSDNQELGVDAVRHGAQDYLIKDQLTAKYFKKSVRYAITRKNLDRVKDEFVSYVTHELCTPLAIIREGISQVTEGIQGDINEQQKRYLNASLSGINRLGHIVEELLDIAKLEFRKIRLEQEEFNLVKLVEETINIYHSIIEKAGLEIKTAYSAENIKVYADKDRITQVFINLISNAIKFTERGFIEISLIEKGGMVQCSLADTGKGIAEEDLPKLFHKFEQIGHKSRLKDKGTGLGLSICKGLVEVHHGKIWVESKVNEGTKFIFTLPKYAEELVQA